MYLFITRVLATLLFPVIGMVAAAHQPVFKILLSEKWSMSGDLFVLLAPACALQAVAALSGTVRMALWAYRHSAESDGRVWRHLDGYLADIDLVRP